MSWEAVFSLLFCTFLIGYLMFTFNAYESDTVLYEYQLANDFAEVIYKSDVGYFNNEFNELLDKLSGDSGYCILVKEVGILSSQRIYNTCTIDNNEAKTNVVMVKRRLPGIVPGRSIEYYVWVD